MRFALAVPLALLLSLFPFMESASAQVTQKQTTAALAQGSVISGSVVDQQSGLPIARAAITLFRGPTTVATTTTDKGGRFAFSAVTPGAYFLGIAAPGYGSVHTDDLFATAGASLQTTITLAAQSTRMRTIASVSTRGGAGALQTTTVIQNNISADLIAATGYSRAGDALLTLPGINPSPNGVHGSTIGYSLPLDIRGIGSNETQVLFDGHPVGAVGANAFPGQAFFNQAPVIFDFQNSPSDGLQNIQVVYGSGAVGLYGIDSIGGVIDMQSINPTRDPHFSLTQGVGSYARQVTSADATGTIGKLGYAFASGVNGTTGEFAPGKQAQIGLIGSNQTSANIAANTYFVSGDYVQRDSLGKLRYSFSNATQLTVTAYAANSFADKSGNGDDDYVTYPYQQLVGQGIIAAAPAGVTTITGANGQTFSCTGAIAAVNNAHPNGLCETAAQYAAATQGPQGGGEGPFQTLHTSDYDARLTTAVGPNQLVFDTFVDNFWGIYSRSTNFNGSAHQNVVVTRGALASDEIQSGKNDLGFGFYAQVQKITGGGLNLTTDAAGNPALVPYSNPEVDANINNFFIRDAYLANDHLSFFFNGWEKFNSVSRSMAFDPRLSIVYRPTFRDVFRLTGGRSTDAPFAGIQAQTVQFNTDVTNIQPACGGSTIVGSSGNPNIQSVSGSDVEVAYGHSFREDTIVQIAAYNTSLQDPIFDSSIPATVFGTSPGLAALIAALNGTPGNPGRYEQICNVPATPEKLSLTAPVNIAAGTFRGVNLSGRVRFDRQVYMSYGYNIQSAVFNGVPDSILVNNPFLINGVQIAGIPMHTASLGVDYSNARGGNEVRLDANWVSANNSYYIGPYTYVNGFIRQSLTRNLTLNIGGLNIFDAYSNRYGLIGEGFYQPENQFFHDANVAEEAYNQGLPENIGESFGIPPPQILVSVTYHM
jgi:outer membrane receptor for ferrienterochelin and colicin